MRRNVILSVGAGAIALGLSSAAHGAMPILDAAQGVDMTLVTPVQSAKARCWPPFRDCRYQCRRQHTNPVALQNCFDRCARAYRRCVRR
jgi:hypothetical protein